MVKEILFEIAKQTVSLHQFVFGRLVQFLLLSTLIINITLSSNVIGLKDHAFAKLTYHVIQQSVIRHFVIGQSYFRSTDYTTFVYNYGYIFYVGVITSPRNDDLAKASNELLKLF